MGPSEEGGYIDAPTPDDEMRPLPTDVHEVVRYILGSRTDVQAEIDDMCRVVKSFYAMQPDEVMRWAAGFSARCTELWIQLHRVETRDRTFKQIRTMQVGPLLEELDRQFRLASRLVEVRRQDIETARGFS